MDMGINMKMSKKFLVGVLIFFVCSVLFIVVQVDNIIIFNGIVFDIICMVIIDGGVMVIDMGIILVVDLKVYIFGVVKNFFFSLVDCLIVEEGGNSIVCVIFGGVFDIVNSDYFKNQVIDELVIGVVVVFFDEVGNVMKNNEEGFDVDIFLGVVIILFIVKMVKLGDVDLMKGIVQIIVIYNVIYY